MRCHFGAFIAIHVHVQRQRSRYCSDTQLHIRKVGGLMVVGPPRLVSESYQRRRVLRAGVNLRLVCPVESPPPPPIVTWSKDGQGVHLGWERYRVHDGVLRVRSVDVADSGVYVCHATNGFGTIDVKYLVYVYGILLRRPSFSACYCQTVTVRSHFCRKHE